MKVPWRLKEALLRAENASLKREIELYLQRLAALKEQAAEHGLSTTPWREKKAVATTEAYARSAPAEKGEWTKVVTE